MCKRIGLRVVNPRTELLPAGLLEVAVRQVFLQRRLDLRQVGISVQVAATGRDNAAIAAYLPVALAVVQGGQQLAHRQVAGAAENYQVELVGRDQLSHICSSKFLKFYYISRFFTPFHVEKPTTKL